MYGRLATNDKQEVMDISFREMFLSPSLLQTLIKRSLVLNLNFLQVKGEVHIHCFLTTSKSKAARKILNKLSSSLESKINRVKAITGVPEVYILSLKVAQNSFQHFPRRRF